MSSRLPLYCLGLLSLCTVAALYYAALDTIKTLSPQGCRMSWMSPSYVLQSGFDRSWTPLASRYSLWLYREVGWEGHELRGTPVLFIPGNAGSSHQVRSIASSATRQYYSNPYEVSSEFRSKHLKPLDVFAVEFNEDLSAFHGTTLDVQKEYTLRAIDYVLSLYPADTTIIILGHSMGGVVGTALLPHPRIAAIITMSTPHTLPPARFDRRIEHIYSDNEKILLNEPTPILSLCGGATDLMIPSESCILPEPKNSLLVSRRTLFSSALEGSWTGVGHREMVWCHQVRWRIARAVLELGATSFPQARAAVLDTWIRDGHTLPPTYRPSTASFYPEGAETLPSGLHLSLKNPAGSRTYLLPVSILTSRNHDFLLYVSQGSIPPTSPHNPLPLRASVYGCDNANNCKVLQPSVLKLIPNPSPGRPFPVPDEGSDESEGVVVFQASVPVGVTNIAVRIEDADGRGWVAGGFIPNENLVVHSSSTAALFSPVSIDVSSLALRTNIRFPNLLANSLVIYKTKFRVSAQCANSLLAPLLQYTSHPSETHYFPLTSSSPVLVHMHASGPFVSSAYTYGIDFAIYTTGENNCAIERLDLSVDMWATLGRWGVRYAAPAASWAVGIAGLLLYDAWRSAETTGTMPSVASSLATFVRKRLPMTMIPAFVISLIPLPPSMWLGNQGELFFAGIAPLMLLAVSGIVIVSWLMLLGIMLPLRILAKRISPHHSTTTSPKRTSALVSLGLMCLLIFLLVPWQVGFLGCWIYHLYTCASFQPKPVVPDAVAIPLIPRDDEDKEDDQAPPQPSPTAASLVAATTNSDMQNQQEHLLLLMTWLLPLAAPVLAVWVRTLFTAGFTTPFNGDHNVLYVIPFLVLVDPSWGRSWMWNWQPGVRITSKAIQPKPRWTMLLLVAVTLLWGARYTYIVFDAASVVLGCGVVAWLLRRQS